MLHYYKYKACKIFRCIIPAINFTSNPAIIGIAAIRYELCGETTKTIDPLLFYTYNNRLIRYPLSLFQIFGIKGRLFKLNVVNKGILHFVRMISISSTLKSLDYSMGLIERCHVKHKTCLLKA